MKLELTTAILTAVSCGVGYLMIAAGLGKHVLEPRRQQRRWPSCGRRIEARVCASCGSV